MEHFLREKKNLTPTHLLYFISISEEPVLMFHSEALNETNNKKVLFTHF